MPDDKLAEALYNEWAANDPGTAYVEWRSIAEHERGRWQAAANVARKTLSPWKPIDDHARDGSTWPVAWRTKDGVALAKFNDSLGTWQILDSLSRWIVLLNDFPDFYLDVDVLEMPK